MSVCLSVCHFEERSLTIVFFSTELRLSVTHTSLFCHHKAAHNTQTVQMDKVKEKNLKNHNRHT